MLHRTTLAGFPAHEAGSGHPLLFVHGAFADHHGFDGWLPRFAAAGLRAVAASRRGRLGLPPERASGLSFDDYLDDVRRMLDALGGTAVLVGHSLGGLLAQKLAEEGRAKALVLLASAPPAMLTAQAVALPHFAPLLPKIMTGRPFVVGNGACSTLALNRVPEADRPAIHTRLTHESGRVYRSLMLGSITVDAAKVRCPVRVVGGLEDRIVAPGLVEKTAKHYGVTAELLPAHGHWLMAEPGWEALADDLARFAARATDPGGRGREARATAG